LTVTGLTVRGVTVMKLSDAGIPRKKPADKPYKLTDGDGL